MGIIDFFKGYPRTKREVYVFSEEEPQRCMSATFGSRASSFRRTDYFNSFHSIGLYQGESMFSNANNNILISNLDKTRKTNPLGLNLNMEYTGNIPNTVPSLGESDQEYMESSANKDFVVSGSNTDLDNNNGHHVFGNNKNINNNNNKNKSNNDSTTYASNIYNPPNLSTTHEQLPQKLSMSPDRHNSSVVPPQSTSPDRHKNTKESKPNTEGESRLHIKTNTTTSNNNAGRDTDTHHTNKSNGLKSFDHATHEVDNKATDFSSSNLFNNVPTKLGVGERNAINHSPGITPHHNHNNNVLNVEANPHRRSSQMPHAQHDVHRASHYTLGHGRHNEEWMYCLDKLEQEHSQQDKRHKEESEHVELAWLLNKKETSKKRHNNNSNKEQEQEFDIM